jgi:hypothetical protein
MVGFSVALSLCSSAAVLTIAAGLLAPRVRAREPFVLQPCPVMPLVIAIALSGLVLSAFSWRSGEHRALTVVMAGMHLLGILASCITLHGSLIAV